jgi:hypothetical protein
MASISFPSNPTNGQVYKAPNNVTYQYKQSKLSWSTTLAPDALALNANPSATPPSNPIYGTFWMDTDSNTLYVYVNNNGTAEWQKVTGGTGTSTDTSDPGLALEGNAVYDGDIVLNDIGIFLETTPE